VRVITNGLWKALHPAE